MIKNNYINPKLNKTFILGRGLIDRENKKSHVLVENKKCTKGSSKKNTKKDLPLEHQKFLKSLINKTKCGKGFKKV
jgi:hypothetical protein